MDDRFQGTGCPPFVTAAISLGCYAFSLAASVLGDAKEWLTVLTMLAGFVTGVGMAVKWWMDVRRQWIREHEQDALCRDCRKRRSDSRV
jgi:hypothetical protein